MQDSHFVLALTLFALKRALSFFFFYSYYESCSSTSTPPFIYLYIRFCSSNFLLYYFTSFGSCQLDFLFKAL